MKKSTKWLVALMAALAVAPNVAYLSQPTSELVSAVEQAQQQKLLSLGASLNPQQQEQTKNLLGAKDFSAAKTQVLLFIPVLILNNKRLVRGYKFKLWHHKTSP